MQRAGQICPSLPLKLQDVARSMGVCDRTVRAWLDDGLPYYKPSPRVTLIDPSDLAEWLSAWKQQKITRKEREAERLKKIVDDVMGALP